MSKTVARAQAKGMAGKPSAEATSAWMRLVRVQQNLLSAIERDLKSAGFPPLTWYDALVELVGHERGEMRPVELEKHMLLPQYGLSRLVDRMVEAGYVERKICSCDGRGQFVGITSSGRALQKKMWEIYAAAIERHVGAKLSKAEAANLCDLLEKLR